MKKTVAVLFVFVFLFSLGGIHAQARAQTSFGYIPLVSPGGSASVPMAFRARQAFDKLAPRLAAAQAKGQIVYFEPEFDHALLKVEYKTGFDLASAASLDPRTKVQVFADPKAVLDLTGAGLTRPEGTANVTQGTSTIYLGVYNSCFETEDFGGNDVYMAYLYDASDRLLSSRHGQLDSEGKTSDCFSEGLWQDMIPGDTFKLDLYDSGGVSIKDTYTTTIPRLNINSITLKTKTIKGIAPASQTAFIHLFHPLLDDTQGDIDAEGSEVTTSSKGAWSVKFGTYIDMRGGDEVDVIWPTAVTGSNPFMFYRYLFVPYLDCQLGGNYCSLYGIPGKAAKASLTHARKSYKTSGKFDYYGWFGSYFYDANTDPVFMAAGDRVIGSGASPMVIPSLTAVPDRSADTIAGSAPASTWFEVDLDAFFHATGWKSDSQWVGSDASYGTYTADFSGSFAINTADIIEASIYYVDPVTGNETDYWNYVVYH